MPDSNFTRANGIVGKYKDMGDGTFAEQMATDLGASASSLVFTMTQVVLVANTSTQLAPANPLRRYLAIQVIGTAPLNLSITSPALANQGWALDAAPAAGRQGGHMLWEGNNAPKEAINALSTSATTAVVIQGA